MLPIGFAQSYMPLIGTALPVVHYFQLVLADRDIYALLPIGFARTEGTLPISFTKRYMLPIGFAQTNVLLPVSKWYGMQVCTISSLVNGT